MLQWRKIYPFFILFLMNTTTLNGLPGTSPGNSSSGCNGMMAAAKQGGGKFFLSTKSRVYSFAELLAKKQELLSHLRGVANRFAQVRKQLVSEGDKIWKFDKLEKIYAAIKARHQEPGYYYLPVSPQDVARILKYGYLEEGREFNYLGGGPLVGQNGNFMFVRCQDLPEVFAPSRFFGSVNVDKISSEHLELVVPSVVVSASE